MSCLAVFKTRSNLYFKSINLWGVIDSAAYLWGHVPQKLHFGGVRHFRTKLIK